MLGMTLTRSPLTMQLTSGEASFSRLCADKRRTLRATIVTTFSHMTRDVSVFVKYDTILGCFFGNYHKLPQTSNFRKVMRQNTECIV